MGRSVESMIELSDGLTSPRLGTSCGQMARKLMAGAAVALVAGLPFRAAAADEKAAGLDRSFAPGSTPMGRINPSEECSRVAT